MAEPDKLLSLTVPSLLRLRGSEMPSRLALSAQAADGSRDRLTYAQLVQRMDAVAAGLAARGFRAGDRIGIFLTNDQGRECFLTALGALALGAVFVPLNTRYADPEIGHALDLVEPDAVVASEEAATRLAGLRPGLRLLVVGAGSESRFERWPEPTGRSHEAVVEGAAEADTLGCLLFTSGTTSRSKAVMHSHRTMIGAGLCCSRALGLEQGDLYQAGWPFFTSSAFNLGGMSSWVAGAAFVFEGQLDNAGRLELVAAERGTFYHGVPSVIHFLAEELGSGPKALSYDLSSVRRIGYGGSAMPAQVVSRIEQMLPDADQVQIYGLTESGPTGTVLPPADKWDKLGSVGHAMPFCSVTIVDDAGARLPTGEEGEIVIEGPGVAIGYFRNPEATAEAFSGPAIKTGDVGRMDADGYVFFTDRKKDIINRGGLKIASVAVEAVLYQHPGVLEAAVFAVPHKALGEDVAAAVVARPGVTLDPAELAEFCKGRIADYSQPRRWFLLSELPRNPMGKVLKTELRARATA